MADPEIYLAIDNCFASKRWTLPSDWTAIIKNLGIDCIEASADTECDPLYMDAGYLKDWVSDVKKACKKNGTRVVNLYSGHGSYSTLGLAHTDSRCRERMKNQWIKPLMKMASELDAGIGFFCHAFDSSVLGNPTLYKKYYDILCGDLAELAVYWKSISQKYAGIEQMYSPHQIPWTIKGSERFLSEIYKRAKTPLYLTIDTGHQSGQRNFLEQSDRHDYEIALPEDTDTYKWLEMLGGYSPIVHLQQTDGKHSSHFSFTPERNSTGIIHGNKVLSVLKKFYAKPENKNMPLRCDKLYLTLEPFFSTGTKDACILKSLEQSAAYWREVIPKDGMKLSDLV